MKTCLNPLVVVTACLAIFLACPSQGREKKSSEREKPSVWMKNKLKLSQNMLAGLTEGDFEKIGTNAQAMNFLGYLEGWARAGRPEYKRQMTYFDLANQELLPRGKEKNLDGATLAYNQLTVSCVQCHKIVRNAK